MTSFRLIFIDVDASFSIVTQASTIKGYCVVRSPKGTTEPMYFDKGATSAIHAMIGIPTADWPDIAEAIAFNREYGLYISAPAGTSEEYPSYYGGVYLTSRGIFPFFEVADKDEVNFVTEIAIGDETTQYVKKGKASKIEIDPSMLGSDAAGNLSQGSIKISGIDPVVFQNIDQLVLNFWGSDLTAAKAKVYKLVLDGDKVRYLDENDKPSEAYIGKALSNADGTYTISLGGNNSNVTAANKGAPYFSFKNLIDFSVFADATGALTEADELSIAAALISGSAITGKTPAFRGLRDRLSWTLSVKSDTYAYFVQKSPSEKVTKLTFSNIGYDRYKYDLGLAYTVNATSNTTGVVTDDARDLFVNIKTSSAGAGVLPTGIYQKVGVTFVNVTNQYKTKYVRLRNSANGADNADYTDTLRIVANDASGTLTLIEVVEGGTYEPVKSIGFNSLTFNVSEEVYPGINTSGGEFTGSLSEIGKDSFGGNIYMENVLPDDSLSFVEVKVVKTFDEDLNSKGFFEGNRVVDLFGPAPDIFSAYLSGQRYVTSVVNKNIADGTVGCAPRDEFVPILMDGWNEAARSKYDECYLFMEFSGEESIKPVIFSLRATHKLSTFISPKIITKAEFLAPETIVVSGRSTGTAQYVGEFLVKDAYTGKKYWCKPIGDVGIKLSRIIENKLGGWAPMWNDITGGLGGQLPRDTLKAMWDFDDEAQKILDQKGLNPIVRTPKDGLMIVSQKTTQDPNSLTDWSYLGHSMAFDLCKREIRDNVMRPQIGKPNDDYWQGIRTQQTQAILDKRITGSQPIWAKATVDCASVNTDAIKAQRKFLISVKVKVNVFSEAVVLVFTNVGQTTSL